LKEKKEEKGASERPKGQNDFTGDPINIRLEKKKKEANATKRKKKKKKKKKGSQYCRSHVTEGWHWVESTDAG